MQRVYLLLRKNQQTGPFTIGELLQQSIGPDDMIWIEGKSMSWIPVPDLELRAYYAPAPAEQSGKGIERNAEESRPWSSSRTQPRVYVDKPGEPAPSFAYNDEDTIVIVDHRKERRNMWREVLMTATVVALFAGGIYGSRTLVASRGQVAAAPTKMVSTDQNSAKPVLLENAPVENPKQVPADTTARQLQAPPVASLVKKSPAKTDPDSANRPAATTAQVTEPPVVNTNEVKTESSPKLQEENPPVVKKEKKEAATDKQENKEPEKASEPEKKKGFLRNLFHKKKKDGEE